MSSFYFFHHVVFFQEESKEVAKAFEEFDDFFKQSSKSAKTFVRGNTINPDASGTTLSLSHCVW